MRGKLDRFGTAWGTGRRKTAVARVRVKAGTGKFIVNERPMEEYFTVERDRNDVLAPLRVTERLGQVDIAVNVEGGGPTGQAGAIILGIARALEAINPSLHQQLGENGFLTRDSRMVERKKYGYKKARKSFQFSKR
ncbi:MAG: 30S ribosomal protein S9 [Planctomycetaceae bacterium]|nr:30S ribosomal protein S9 [Planctomycetaceae bacterium]